MPVTSRHIVAAIVALATIPSAAGADKTKPTGKEDRLLAAGFVVRPATSPAMQTMLNGLPQHKFVRRVNGDMVSYVYADSLRCGCLYVGSQQAYGAYQRSAQQQQIADENQMAAMDYADSRWDWGPWGGAAFGPWFGWREGLGW